MTTEESTPDTIWFVSAADVSGPGVTLHKSSGATTALTRRFDEVKEDWRAMVTSIINLANTTDALAPKAGLRLDELTIELGFTAAGKLAFIAEAGVSGSITLSFKPGEGRATP
ncbi:Pepco domain-containing protein [Nocardioides ungokensis]|uniref:Pepco domain-containing protein n=1 Tax=Nocardioides ungokensis TaxID=1643322 RepID=UPI0015DFDF1D|nr:hypothetical protein [Nocardioides ungokensis]